MAYSVFISYAQADRDAAHEIANQLEKMNGLRCWIAPRDVRPGREFGDEIIKGIEASRHFILVLSAAANASKFVRKEVERAVSKDKPVFTIRIENVLPSPALELFVSGTHWIDAWSGNRTSQMQRLARLLCEEDASASEQRQQPAEPERSQGVSLATMGLTIAAGTALGILVIVAALSFWQPKPTVDPFADFPLAPEQDKASESADQKTLNKGARTADPYADFATEVKDPFAGLRGPPVATAPKTGQPTEGTVATQPAQKGPRADAKSADDLTDLLGPVDLSRFGTPIIDITKLRLTETKEISRGFVQIIVSNLGTGSVREITIGYGRKLSGCSPNLESYDGVKKFGVNLSAGDSVTLFQQVSAEAKEFCIVDAR